jgi:hypothetical protein
VHLGIFASAGAGGAGCRMCLPKNLQCFERHTGCFIIKLDAKSSSAAHLIRPLRYHNSEMDDAVRNHMGTSVSVLPRLTKLAGAPASLSGQYGALVISPSRDGPSRDMVPVVPP